LDGYSSLATSVAFLQQLRAHHAEPLIAYRPSALIKLPNSSRGQRTPEPGNDQHKPKALLAHSAN
jgi:hypothetical protein